MNLEESKRWIPEGLVKLYETTLGFKIGEPGCEAAWKRLSDCVKDRMQGLINRRQQLSDAMANLIKSQKAYITIEEKIQKTPKSHQKDVLDMTFEAGFKYGLMSIDKIEVEAMQKVQGDIDLQFEALRVFSERIGESLNELGDQKGASYYHELDPKTGNPIPYYSGGARPPLRPSASPAIPGWSQDPNAERCWCAWCMMYVDKPKTERGDLSKCEDCCHQCGDGEWRMLTTALKIPHDTRAAFDPDKDRDMSKP